MTDEGHAEVDALLERLERELDATYSQAYEELRKKQAKYMAAYERDLKRRREQVEAGKITEDDLKAWQERQLMGAEWYRQMVETLAEDLKDVDAKAASIVNGYTPDAYATNANFGTYQVERSGKVDTAFTLYDRDAVERLVAERPTLLPVVQVDEDKDKLWNQRHVTSAITQSVLQGEGIPQAAKRLRDVVGMDKRAAVRSARTALTGAENAGRVDSYKRAQGMGIALKQEWLATLDRRTRDSHRHLDGERVEVGGLFSNGLRYPGDPNGAAGDTYNCRCTLVVAVEGVDQSRAKRDDRLGDMTYAEWLEEHRG